MGRQVLLQILKCALLLSVTGTLLSCGGNVYEAMSDKTTHEAIVEDVKKLTNAQKFSEAVGIIEANPSLIPSRDEKMTFASAYAGDCGLTFAGVFDSLASASGSPMQFAMSAFKTTLINPSQCYKAQLILESIGAAGLRTTNENIALFLIGFAKVGAYLRNRADSDPITHLGDGTLDAGYDSCLDTKLPKAEVKQVMSGFGLMIENIAAIGAYLSGGMAGNITSIGAACTALGMTCNATDPTAISDGDATTFRNAIKSDNVSGLGIESCPMASLPTCC